MPIQGFPLTPNGGASPVSIAPIRAYFQTVLPAVFDDSLSYYEGVCRLTNKLNELIEAFNQNPINLEEMWKRINEIEQEMEEWKNGGYDEYIQASADKWVSNNLAYIFDHTVKQVYFGLTDDGYFCAYIPDSWDDIDFDTGAVYDTPTYGRLILRYNVDGQGVIDNA